ncbi:MAG: hypothetical protein WCZ10_14145 [Desulfobulbaceae bacterium]
MAKTAKSRTATAWHIVDYRRLFYARDKAGREIQEVCYSQRPIVGHNEWAVLYLQRMGLLRRDLGREAFASVRLLFDDMLDHSQRYRGTLQYLRGYVLDEQLRPAKGAKIGQLFGLDRKAADKALKLLKNVGLIEEVTLPEGPEGPQDSPPPPEDEEGGTAAGGKNPRPKPHTGGGKGQGGKRGKKPAGGRKKGETGGDVEPCGDTSTSLLERESESLRPTASANQERENLRPSASIEREGAAVAAQSRNGAAGGPCTALAGRRGKAEAEAEGKAQSEPGADLEPTAEGDSQTEPPLSPTTTPPMPMEPTQAEPGGAVRKRFEAMAEQWWDRSGEYFAEEIFKVIYPFGIRDANETAREKAEFASMWQRVLLCKFGPTKISALWEGGIKDAHATVKRADRVKGTSKAILRPGGYWTKLFASRLGTAVASQGIEARASPAAGAG